VVYRKFRGREEKRIEGGEYCILSVLLLEKYFLIKKL
jgi:hypothetical protein